MSVRVAVLAFPGSCDDRDALRAVELVGAEPVRVWHADSEIGGAAAEVRAWKVFDLDLDVGDAREAMKLAGRIAEQVLSNPLIEEYDVAVQEPVAV